MADTVANWIMAVTTACALAAALWAGNTARRLYGIEHQRELDRELAEERRQADLIASWVSWTDQPRIALKLPNGETSRANLAMQNGSAVPVYDVLVRFYEAGVELGSQAFHVISPTGSTAHYREIKCAGVAQLLALEREPDTRVDIRVSVEFTDTQSTRWIREASGQLLKVLP